MEFVSATSLQRFTRKRTSKNRNCSIERAKVSGRMVDQWFDVAIFDADARVLKIKNCRGSAFGTCMTKMGRTSELFKAKLCLPIRRTSYDHISMEQ
jgi:hypothetical protein